MSRRHRISKGERIQREAETYRSEAMKACKYLKGAALETAKAEIEKRYDEILLGRSASGPRDSSHSK